MMLFSFSRLFHLFSLSFLLSSFLSYPLLSVPFFYIPLFLDIIIFPPYFIMPYRFIKKILPLLSLSYSFHNLFYSYYHPCYLSCAAVYPISYLHEFFLLLLLFSLRSFLLHSSLSCYYYCYYYCFYHLSNYFVYPI